MYKVLIFSVLFFVVLCCREAKAQDFEAMQNMIRTRQLQNTEATFGGSDYFQGQQKQKKIKCISVPRYLFGEFKGYETICNEE